MSSIEQLVAYEAINLFVDRARAVKHDFALTAENADAVAEICTRLDGLPLAIELAAPRVRLFPPRLILQRLENRMQFLTGALKDLPARQRTLRATIDWSHNLLSTEEKILFRRLAVFASGATYEAVEAICGVVDNSGDDAAQALDVFQGLEALLDHSLLRLVEDGDDLRYAMLETIKEYAQEQLEHSGEAELIRRRHVDYFLALAETAETELRHADQVTWLARLEREHDNLRAALDWSLNHDSESAPRLAASLGRFWHVCAHHAEGRHWLEEALAAGAREGASDTAQANALHRAGLLAYFQANTKAALELFQRSLALFRTLDDKSGIAMALCGCAMCRRVRLELPEAWSLIEESLQIIRETNDVVGKGEVLFWHGLIALFLGETERAALSVREAAQIADSQGDVSALAACSTLLGDILFAQGDLDQARLQYENGLKLARSAGELVASAYALNRLIRAAYFQGDYELADKYATQHLLLARSSCFRKYMSVRWLV